MKTSWYGSLGVLAAAVSLYNFVQHTWNVPTTTLFAEILEYYRALFHPIASFVGSRITELFNRSFGGHIYIPNDFLILYGLGVGTLIRTQLRTIKKSWMTSYRQAKFNEVVLIVANAVFWPFAPIIIMLFIALLPFGMAFGVALLIVSPISKSARQTTREFFEEARHIRAEFLDEWRHRKKLGAERGEEWWSEADQLRLMVVSFSLEICKVIVVFLTFVAMNASGLSLF